MSQDQFNTVLVALTELQQDTTLPKNVQIKLLNAIRILSENKDESSIKKNRVLSEIEELNEDINMQPYVRNQLFTVVSLLEGI